jgi:hypothetical protein
MFDWIVRESLDIELFICCVNKKFHEDVVNGFLGHSVSGLRAHVQKGKRHFFQQT